MVYRISPNKRAGRGGRKHVLIHVNIITISAENFIQIGSVVSEIRPGKLKSRGRVYLGRRIYSAKYGNLKDESS